MRSGFSQDTEKIGTLNSRIVVNVLEEEHEKDRATDPEHVTMKELQTEIQELKAMVRELSSGSVSVFFRHGTIFEISKIEE